MRTHVFKLTCGVECEVKEFTGKHQRILTEQSKTSFADKLNTALADAIIRVGSVKVITLEFVESMLASDRRRALTEIRQFTMDDQESFEFDFTYEDEDGEEEIAPQEVDVSTGFPYTPLKVIDGDTVKDAEYIEYSEVQKLIEFTLPGSGELARITLLDGHGEKAGEKYTKKQLSSHTPIKMRNPQIFREGKDDGKGSWIQADLDRMSWKDIAYIRSTIKEMEGSVDTEIRFKHPNADNLPRDEKFVTVDLLGEISFFFPSGAI